MPLDLRGRTFRFGEASHPGPSLLRIATSNPTGLRGKESLCVDFQPGIHCYSETQLSHVTQHSTCNNLRYHARCQGRQLRCHAGAPAPLRSGSEWAGQWTGVLTTSDFPSRSIRLALPAGLHETGRIQVTHHQVGELPVLCANVYGFPSGPTFPRALADTDLLLEPLTRELVLGRTGPRLICGDRNQSHETLQQTQLWSSQGWSEVQLLAHARWSQEICPTCKHATHRDQIWISPELAALLHTVEVQDVFQEHSSVLATFQVPDERHSLNMWPLPSELPWPHIQADKAALQVQPTPLQGRDSTLWFKEFSGHFESAFAGCVSGLPRARLPTCCQGRGIRVAPEARSFPSVPVTASRHGEDSLTCDLVCLEVKRWFKQLRRLQSLVHALGAAKASPAALSYRLDLWRAIHAAPGFDGGFLRWWGQRHIRLQGSPESLPAWLPTHAVAQAVHEDFRANFRRFEAWHVRRRQEILHARFSQTRDAMFKALRTPSPPQGDTLQVSRTYEVLAVEPSTQQLHVNPPLDMRGSSTWSVQDARVVVSLIDAHTCQVVGPIQV